MVTGLFQREHVMPLSSAAVAIIDGMPQLGAYVFTTGGKTPIRGFTKFKAKLDAAVLAELRKEDPQGRHAPMDLARPAPHRAVPHEPGRHQRPHCRALLGA